jgi:hypothetical protein
MTTRPPWPQLQALQAVQAMDALLVDVHALSSEQDVDSLVAVPDATLRDLPDACP